MRRIVNTTYKNTQNFTQKLLNLISVMKFNRHLCEIESLMTQETNESSKIYFFFHFSTNVKQINNNSSLESTTEVDRRCEVIITKVAIITDISHVIAAF